MYRAFALTALLLSACSGDTRPDSRAPEAAPARPDVPAPADPGPPLAVDAHPLHAAYADNAIAAGQQYGGKTLAVRGWVHAVTEEEVVLTFISYGERNIVCQIDPAHRAGFAKLRRGEAATVIGRCQGAEPAFGVHKDLVVVLQRCRPGD
jgi:tRNA_anti-like